jgi:hypothetical protein
MSNACTTSFQRYMQPLYLFQELYVLHEGYLSFFSIQIFVHLEQSFGLLTKTVRNLSNQLLRELPDKKWAISGGLSDAFNFSIHLRCMVSQKASHYLTSQ